METWLLDFWKRVKQELIALDDRPQTWLEAETKVPHGTFSGWITGNKYPPADAAMAIAQALRLSLDYLMTGQLPTNHDRDIDLIVEAMRRYSPEQKAMAKGVILTIDAARMQTNPSLSSFQERVG